MSAFKLRKENDCLNCGKIVKENFCPNCGQENIVVKEDALHMVTHAVADYFHFEHKFFGTLKPLLLKPGQLTSSYVAGKRVSFIHPIRLYIFVSIVFFLVIFSGSKTEKETGEKPKAGKVNSAKEQDSLQAKKIRDLEEAMKYVPIKGSVKDSIIKAAKEDIKNDGVKANTTVDLRSGKKNKWNGSWISKDTTVAGYEKSQLALPKNKRDGFIKHYISKRSIELNNYPDPTIKLKEDLLHNIPKMMFLLLPLFALILKLVYINKKKYYYEHLVYSFHLHSAIFLSVLLTLLLQWFFALFYDINGWLTSFCSIYIIWYIYRSLRTFYASTRWVTVLKMLFLFFAYSFVLTFCLLIIIAFSFVMI
ncbi:MAG: DUF3667 domain-containing protein [Pedobacter sp.]|nr:DUF3667 domain-containing protein [Pedobacter sp.]